MDRMIASRHDVFTAYYLPMSEQALRSELVMRRTKDALKRMCALFQRRF